MASSNAGQGLDKWLASLNKEKPKPKIRGEWDLQDQRDLDTKNAIYDFINAITRHGSVHGNSDTVGNSVEEKNAARSRATAPGVRGPLSRELPGVAGYGQPGAGKGPEGGLGDAVQQLLHALHSHVNGTSEIIRTNTSDHPSKLQVSDAHRAANSATLKRLGKPGKALNRGLM